MKNRVLFIFLLFSFPLFGMSPSPKSAIKSCLKSPKSAVSPKAASPRSLTFVDTKNSTIPFPALTPLERLDIIKHRMDHADLQNIPELDYIVRLHELIESYAHSLSQVCPDGATRVTNVLNQLINLKLLVLDAEVYDIGAHKGLQILMNGTKSLTDRVLVMPDTNKGKIELDDNVELALINLNNRFFQDQYEWLHSSLNASVITSSSCCKAVTEQLSQRSLNTFLVSIKTIQQQLLALTQTLVPRFSNTQSIINITLSEHEHLTKLQSSTFSLDGCRKLRDQTHQIVFNRITLINKALKEDEIAFKNNLRQVF